MSVVGVCDAYTLWERCNREERRCIMGEVKYRYDVARDGRSMPQEPQGKAASNGPPQSPVQSKLALAACWVALAATIVCNGLFESLRLGGTTSAEVSNEVFAWFAPAGYVFSIWGVIYIALVVWLGYETTQRARRTVATKREAVLFVLSCALNVGWLVAFHFKMIPQSLLIIAVLWCVVAVLYASFRNRGTSLWTRIPFSLYLGWLSVAVVANGAHLATRIGDIPLVANQVSTVVLAIVLLVAAYVLARTEGDLVFPAVVLWAAVGIGVRLMAVDQLVATVLFVLSAVAAFAIYGPAVMSMVRGGKRKAKAASEG